MPSINSSIPESGRAGRFLLGALALAYPALVYWGLRSGLDARLLAVPLIGAGLWRAWPSLKGRLPLGWLASLALLALALAFAKARFSIRAYPVLVNLGLLAVFALSLRRGPSAIERLARLRHPDLDAKGVAYCATVTKVWCAFFVVNGSLAAAVGWLGDDAQWALYNGLIAYILMGLLFAGEWLIRQWIMKAGHA